MAEKSSYTIYEVTEIEHDGEQAEVLVLLGEGKGLDRAEALKDLLDKRNEPEREGLFEASPTRGVKRIRRRITRPVVAEVEEVDGGGTPKPPATLADKTPGSQD